MKNLMNFRSLLRVVEFQVIVLSAIEQLLLATFKTSNTQAIISKAPVEHVQLGLNLYGFAYTKMAERPASHNYRS
jgi:preprotein translocase subunit SecD